MTECQVFHFTIRDLIEALSSFPPETPVLTSGYENGYENIKQPVLRDLVHKPDSTYYDGEFQPAGDDDSKVFSAALLPRIERD